MTEEFKHAIENCRKTMKKYTPEVLDPKKLEDMIKAIFKKEES